MSGIKSPSPVTSTTVSSFGASLTASIASPTSQSAFLAPSANICKSFVLVSIPILVSASKKFFFRSELWRELDRINREPHVPVGFFGSIGEYLQVFCFGLYTHLGECFKEVLFPI